jgi:hypothetical protein
VLNKIKLNMTEGGDSIHTGIDGGASRVLETKRPYQT